MNLISPAHKEEITTFIPTISHIEIIGLLNLRTAFLLVVRFLEELYVQ